MTIATRVYVAHLAGLTVFDPNGDQIGRVRDVVTRPRAGTLPPRVTGLIAELPLRRRIFLPIGRVTAIEVKAVVLGTGTLNLRRFERRPGELLVLEDLLDRRVTIRAEAGEGSGGPVAGWREAAHRGHATVVDIAMERDPRGEWTLTRVAVREYTGRLTKRSELRELSFAQVDGLLGEAERHGAAGLLAVLEDLRAADLANVLQDLSDSRRIEVATALDDERLADVLGELPERDQIEIVTALKPERAADVLEEMDPDDAADLLAELSQPERDVLLDLMEPAEASPVRQLLVYHPGTAGSIMTSEPVIMAPDATVADALARIRHPQLSPAIAASVFVSRPPMATPTGRYLGVAHFQRLLREPPASLLGAVVDNGIDPLEPGTPLSEITRRMATYDLVSMPVVDDGDRLVGAVTVDDVLDHLLPTHWRDRYHSDSVATAVAAHVGDAEGDAKRWGDPTSGRGGGERRA